VLEIDLIKKEMRRKIAPKKIKQCKPCSKRKSKSYCVGISYYLQFNAIHPSFSKPSLNHLNASKFNAQAMSKCS